MTARPRTACLLRPALAACLAAAPAAASAQQQDRGWVDFGDNSGVYSMDGECDDPRFEGPGVHGLVLDTHRGRDAADCRAAYDAGEVTMRDDIINFGSNTGSSAVDGVCDDPRFEGPGTPGVMFGNLRGADANDCRAAWDAGEVSLRTDNILFGTDQGPLAGDGECDDPRFQGPGTHLPRPRGAAGEDASDCRDAFLAGRIEPVERDGLYGLAQASSLGGVEFGDNSSVRARDGVCDDPRFAGPGMAAEDELARANRQRDMSDCAAAWLDGTVTLDGEGGEE